MDFTAFDTLPAASLDDLVENIEALADGSAFDSSTNTSTLGGAWSSWTPTWTNLTVGNGVETGAYKQVGKTVFFRYKLVFGTTTAITGGDPRVTPPVTVNTAYSRVTTGFGHSLYYDAAPNYFPGYCGVAQTDQTKIQPWIYNVSGTYSTVSGYTATVPVAFGTGDEIHFNGTYEAA